MSEVGNGHTLDAPGKVLMAHMTWLEVERAALRNPVILVPLGTLEVQGRHSPMGYDFLLAERLAEEVAKRTGSLVTPTLPYGYSHFSRPFPGTISLKAQTLHAILSDMLEGLIASGFERILLLNNHGLNEPVLGHVADQLHEVHGISFVSIQPSKLAQDLSKGLYEDRRAAFAHGAEPTVSLMLYLFPDSVNMVDAERLEWGDFQGMKLASAGTIKFGDSTLRLYSSFRAHAPTGGMGDATQASAEKGCILFQRMVDYLAAFVGEFGEIDPRAE